MRAVRPDLYQAFRAAGFSEREALRRAAEQADAQPRRALDGRMRQGKWLMHATFAALVLSGVLATLIY